MPATMKKIKLFEQSAGLAPASLKVDRAAGVIRKVKILGEKSVNGRQYTRAARDKAVGLYEGHAVDANHCYEDDKKRDIRDRFAWFENVRSEESGLYGDLHLLDKDDPLAKKLFTAAEQKPDLFGFSHHALGDGRQEGGITMIEEITDVLSVDLVRKPATTKGLFESADGGTAMKKTTPRQLFESLSTNPSWPRWKRQRVLELIEAMAYTIEKRSDGWYVVTAIGTELGPYTSEAAAYQAAMDSPSIGRGRAGQEVEAPPESASADEQAKAAFKGLVCGVFDDDSLDTKAKIAKIGEILKSQEKLLAVAPSGEGRSGKGKWQLEERDGEWWITDGSRDLDGPFSSEREAQRRMDEAQEYADQRGYTTDNPWPFGRGRKGKGEGAYDESDQLRRELTVRDLIESAGLTFPDATVRRAFVKALIPMTDQERKASIAERKHLYEAVQSEPPGGRGPDDQPRERLPFPKTTTEAKRLILQD